MRYALGVLLAACLLLALSTHRERRERRAADARADSLATEHAAAQIREAGWRVALTTTTRDLAAQIAARDSQAAALERALQAARAQVIAATSIEARAEGTSEAVIDSASSGPDSTVYRIADPVLSGSVTTWRDSAIARLDWTATIGLELVQAVGADGRLLSMVRADDERVTPWLRSVEWEPPPAPPGPSRLRWLLAGIALGVIGWEIVR